MNDTNPAAGTAQNDAQPQETASITGAPHWRLTTSNPDGKGVTKVAFEIDLYEPTETAYDAMRKLTACALWWLDTDSGGLWNNLPGTVEQGGTVETR